MSTTNRFAVMGDPIKHSLSPKIHRYFARNMDIELSYDAIQVNQSQFYQAVKAFIEQGGKGLNITAPLKKLAFNIVDSHDDDALIAGSVNSVVIKEDGEMVGSNTDLYGFKQHVYHDLGWSFNSKRVLILGAGGVVPSLINTIALLHPTTIFIVNRDLDKAIRLAQMSPLIEVGTHTVAEFDIIINATSASLQNELPAVQAVNIGQNCCCYDVVYQPHPTCFLQWAGSHGARQCIDGKGMLIHQAAKAFYLWHGVWPDENIISGCYIWQQDR